MISPLSPPQQQKPQRPYHHKLTPTQIHASPQQELPSNNQNNIHIDLQHQLRLAQEHHSVTQQQLAVTTTTVYDLEGQLDVQKQLNVEEKSKNDFLAQQLQQQQQQTAQLLSQQQDQHTAFVRQQQEKYDQHVATLQQQLTALQQHNVKLKQKNKQHKQKYQQQQNHHYTLLVDRLLPPQQQPRLSTKRGSSHFRKQYGLDQDQESYDDMANIHKKKHKPNTAEHIASDDDDTSESS